MRRRDFLTLSGGAAAWPLSAGAQQPAMPVIGFLITVSPPVPAFQLAGLNQGLNETGYIENRNVKIEFRFAEGHYDKFPATCG